MGRWHMAIKRERKRSRLFAIYGNACFWCGGPMKWARPLEGLPEVDVKAALTERWRAGQGKAHDPELVTIDELMPRSRGGKRMIENQVLAHARCNGQRANMIPPKAAFDRHHAMLQSASIAALAAGAGTFPAAAGFIQTPPPEEAESENNPR